MSQLSRLIEQARKTRRVNDIFNIQPAAVTPQEDAAYPDTLLACLAHLESHLLSYSDPVLLPVADLIGELETIAAEL